MSTINIKGLNKAAVLKALFDASKHQGMGFLHAKGNTITLEKAQGYLQQSTYFDYLEGKVMKVDLSKDDFDDWLYDRDNGQGAAKMAVDGIRSNNSTSF